MPHELEAAGITVLTDWLETVAPDEYDGYTPIDFNDIPTP